jgi:hypothetical protein
MLSLRLRLDFFIHQCISSASTVFSTRCPDVFVSFFKLEDIDYEGDSKGKNMSQLLHQAYDKINQDQTFDDHKLFVHVHRERGGVRKSNFHNLCQSRSESVFSDLETVF